MRAPQAPRQAKPQPANARAEQPPHASGSGRNMWNDVDVDTFQEIVGYLPAKSKAAFAGTSGVFHKSEALKEAGKEFQALMTLLKPLNRNSRIKPSLIDQGLAMLDRRMHPEDQQKLTAALTNAVTIQIGKLSERTLTAQEADATLQQAHHLMGKVQDPLKLLGLVSSISAQLGTIDPSSARCPHALLASMRQVISSVALAPHRPGAEMNNDAINLAFAVSGLNRFGLAHLPDAQRAPAFAHHIAAMQRLYASGFRTTVPMFHPMSSALRQVPALPTEHRAEAQFKLNQLVEWRS